MEKSCQFWVQIAAILWLSTECFNFYCFGWWVLGVWITWWGRLEISPFIRLCNTAYFGKGALDKQTHGTKILKTMKVLAFASWEQILQGDRFWSCCFYTPGGPKSLDMEKPAGCAGTPSLQRLCVVSTILSCCRCIKDVLSEACFGCCPQLGHGSDHHISGPWASQERDLGC